MKVHTFDTYEIFLRALQAPSGMTPYLAWRLYDGSFAAAEFTEEAICLALEERLPASPLLCFGYGESCQPIPLVIELFMREQVTKTIPARRPVREIEV